MSDVASRKRGLPLRVKMRHDNHFVEQLAARHATPIGSMAPLSSLEPDPLQPRSQMGELDDLVESIRDKGVLEPILVRPLQNAEEDELGGGATRYRIISGERRYRAALQAGLYEVPVIEMDVSDEEALEIALIENLQRKDLTPFEEAEGYRSLGDRYGYTHEEIARTLGKSRTVVTESLALLQMPPHAREAAQALGIQSKSVLLEVLKAASEAEMVSLLEEVAAKGLNRDDLRRSSRTRPAAQQGARRKPYVFKFRAPDKTYSLALSFRRSTVERTDLIQALEQILDDLRQSQEQDP